MPIKRASNKEVLRAFIVASRDHWKELVGGSFVAILIGVSLTMGLNIPPTVAGLIAFCLAVLLACFLAFRDQFWKRQELRQAITELSDAQVNARHKAAYECFRNAVRLIKDGDLPFHALCKTEVHLLETHDLSVANDLVIEVCNYLRSYDHGHPFAGLEQYVPESEYHAFLSWIHYSPNFDPLGDFEYLYAADAWRIKFGRPEPSVEGRLPLVENEQERMPSREGVKKGLRVSIEMRHDSVSQMISGVRTKVGTQFLARLTFINNGNILRTIRDVEFICAMPKSQCVRSRNYDLLGATRYEDNEDRDSSVPLPIGPDGQEVIASYRTLIKEPNRYEEDGTEFGVYIKTSDGKGGHPYRRIIMASTAKRRLDGGMCYYGKRLEHISLEKEEPPALDLRLEMDPKRHGIRERLLSKLNEGVG